jgi:hypothetical protein
MDLITPDTNGELKENEDWVSDKNTEPAHQAAADDDLPF